MDALKAEGVEQGNRMLTENASPAFKSTLDPALDFFSSAANDTLGEFDVGDVGPASIFTPSLYDLPTPNDANPFSYRLCCIAIHKLLRKSWNANPDLTLRLIFCLRSIHDGKSEKDTFYHAFGWLYRYHPRTAIANLPMLIEPVIDRPPQKRKAAAEGEAKDEKMEEDGDDWTEVEKEEEKPLPGYSHGSFDFRSWCSSTPTDFGFWTIVGYYKDLLNLVTLAVNKELGVEGSSLSSLHNERPWWSYDDERTRKSKRREQPPPSSTSNTKTMPTTSTSDSLAGYERRPRGRPGARVPRYILTKREIKAKRAQQGLLIPSRSPAQIKANEAKEQHERLVKLLAQEAEFRALYIGVARLFAEKLGKELSILQRLDESQSGQPKLSDDERKDLRWQIGLVGKWAPTLGGSHDRQTNIATAIAQLLYSSGSMSSLRLPSPVTPATAVDAKSAETLRSYYRRWIISPLRRFTHVTETFMGLDQWEKIAYEHVPSVCMRQSKKMFYFFDGERFSQFLTDVAKGKRAIQGGVLLPNEMLGEACTLTEEVRSAQDEEAKKTAMMEKQVVEGQWESMLEKMRNEAGALGNCMALCDVSGSMGDIESTIASGRRGKAGRGQFAQPIFPAIALSLIVSHLAKEPFKNSFITFSEQPRIQTIDPTAGLVEIVERMINSPWGMNTDLQAVFLNLILPLAVKNKVPKVRLHLFLYVCSVVFCTVY